MNIPVMAPTTPTLFFRKVLRERTSSIFLIVHFPLLKDRVEKFASHRVCHIGALSFVVGESCSHRLRLSKKPQIITRQSVTTDMSMCSITIMRLTFPPI